MSASTGASTLRTTADTQLACCKSILTALPRGELSLCLCLASYNFYSCTLYISRGRA